MTFQEFLSSILDSLPSRYPVFRQVQANHLADGERNGGHNRFLLEKATSSSSNRICAPVQGATGGLLWPTSSPQYLEVLTSSIREEINGTTVTRAAGAVSVIGKLKLARITPICS